MIENQDHSNGHTDVGVISLNDRRRLKDQEAQIADLSRQLAEANARAQPGLTRNAISRERHLPAAANQWRTTSKR